MTACIFCKIIEGTIPSAKIYEDEHRTCLHGYYACNKRACPSHPENTS